MKTGLIAAVTVATATGVCSAEIVYSGVLNQTADSATGPGTIDIMGHQWGFGHESGGPLDYSFVSANNSGSGVFVELGSLLVARNFTSGDTIGTFTEVLNMFPTGGGSNDNINLYNYAAEPGGEGNFPSNGTGFVGFGFGSGVNFNYGWMRFTLEGPTRRVTLVDWAYESVTNQSIAVGTVPAPGVLAVMAVAGLSGRRRRS